MSQPAAPEALPDAAASGEEAWTRLLHLETQVQLTQASLTQHSAELTHLRQTTDTISDSLRTLLERLAPAAPNPPPPTPPVQRPRTVQSPIPARERSNIPRPATPDVYNGDRASGERFLQSCATYLQLCGDDFVSDELKIAWVLSYMKLGRAATYALRVFRRPGGVASFTDWAEFEQEFRDEFFPRNPAKSAALILRDREQYGQGKRSLDEYIDSFRALVEQAEYPDGLQLCLTFREGLHPTLMERIDNLAEGRPADDQVLAWYRVAREQWQLMELKRDLRKPAHPAPPTRPPAMLPRRFPIPAPPMATVAPPTIPALPPGAPMDVDASRQRAPLPLSCRRCGAQGHFARHCPRGLEVRYLSPEEQEELLLQLLAARDIAGVPSPDTPIPEETAKDAHVPEGQEEQSEGFQGRGG